MSSLHPLILILVGPTAVGKTRISIRLAQHFGTDILSADSRQCYRRMDIGTAKPTLQERASVRHYFIDSHDLTETLSAGMYQTWALSLLKEKFKTKPLIIVSGGSGLYIKALCEGIDEMPKVSVETRKKWMRIYRTEGLNFLLKTLEKNDLKYYRAVDKNNTQRIIRALEVIDDTGKPFSFFRKNEREKRPFNMIKIGLNMERQLLYKRIHQRIDTMIQAGLLEEVKSLLPYKACQSLQTIGYQELFWYLESKNTWEECLALLQRNTRRYAKRQITWFKKDDNIRWFSPEDYDKILQYIDDTMNSLSSDY